MEGLRDGPRPGAPRAADDARIGAAVARASESLPPGATRRSSRGAAAAGGLPASAARRVRRASGSRPHRRETPGPSTGPDSVAGVRGVVGLRMAPPGRAPAPCADGEGRVRASDRGRPVLPVRPGRPARRGRDRAAAGPEPFRRTEAASGILAGVGRSRAHDTPAEA